MTEAHELGEFGERVPLPNTSVTLRWLRPELATPADFARLVEVYRAAFNGGPDWFRLGVTPEEHLRWKTEAFPGDAAIGLTEDGDRVVGGNVRLWRRWLVAGREQRLREGMDAALHPDYQGYGISGTRQENSEHHGAPPADLESGFEMHPASRRRRAETSSIGPSIETLVKPLRPSGLVGRFRQSRAVARGGSRTREALDARGRILDLRRVNLALGARLIWSLLRDGARPRTSVHGWSTQTIGEFGPEANEFWARVCGAFDLIQVRDRDFLNWRYGDRRAGDFTIRAVFEHGKLLGYSALRLTDREAVLADLLALPERADVARGLIEDAIVTAREAGAPLLRCWMASNHPYRSAAQTLGFVSYQLDLHFSLQPISDNAADLRFLSSPDARIHLMTGDSDHI